jgi:CHAT domain-containing protein
MKIRLLVILLVVLSTESIAQNSNRIRFHNEIELLANIVKADSLENAMSILESNQNIITDSLYKNLLEKGKEELKNNNNYKASLLFEIAAIVAKRRNKDPQDPLLAEVLYNLGVTYFAQGEINKSEDSYLKFIENANTSYKKKYLTLVYKDLARIQKERGNYEKAITYAQQCYDNAETEKDELGQAIGLLYLGNLNFDKGNLDEAKDQIEKSLQVFSKLQSEIYQGVALAYIARVYEWQGKYEEAAKSVFKSLKLLDKSPQEKGEALFAKAALLGDAGDYENMLAVLDTCLQIYNTLKNQNKIALTLYNIGYTYELKGDYTKAKEYLERGYNLAYKIGSMRIVFRAEMELGVVFHKLGKYEVALESFNKSLFKAEFIQNKHLIALVLLRIADLYNSMGQHDKSVEHAIRSVDLAQQLKHTRLYFKALTLLGQSYQKRKDINKAIESFNQSIKIAEELRYWGPYGEPLRQSIFGTIITPYYEMVNILVDQGKYEEALVYAEKAKARVLGDILGSGRINISNNMSVQEKREEDVLRKKLDLLNNKIHNLSLQSNPDEKQLETLYDQLRSARMEYETFRIKLYVAHPELKVKRGEVAPFTLKEAEKLISTSNTALLEYVSTKDRLILFVIARKPSQHNNSESSTELKAYSINIDQATLNKKVELFLKRIGEGSLDAETLGQDIYNTVLKPAEQQIQGCSILAIVPDGPLWMLPFKALVPSTNRYLVHDFAVYHPPSLGFLASIDNERTNNKSTISNTPISKEKKPLEDLLAIGNPKLDEVSLPNSTNEQSITQRGKYSSLPFSEEEVNTIGRGYSKVLRSKVFYGPQATKEVVKSLAPEVRLLHIATHGILDNERPLYSYILLANEKNDENGKLEAWEMMGLNLKADLVVLSACEMARGKIGYGEGIIGMSWSLFVAGSPTTVLSQWKVDSERTKDLMIEFHKNLASNMAQSSSKFLHVAKALQQAELKVLQNGSFKHPAFWAGFVVMGDGR